MIGCINHCAGCGSHFSSVAAFDAHRFGDHATARYCEEPLDVASLAPKTAAGICKIGAPVPRISVTVHALARDLENWSQRGSSELVRKAKDGLREAA